MSDTLIGLPCLYLVKPEIIFHEFSFGQMIGKITDECQNFKC